MSGESLGADFKIAHSRYIIEKYSDVTLQVRLSTGVATVYNTYDFVGRILNYAGRQHGQQRRCHPLCPA